MFRSSAGSRSQNFDTIPLLIMTAHHRTSWSPVMSTSRLSTRLQAGESYSFLWRSQWCWVMHTNQTMLQSMMWHHSKTFPHCPGTGYFTILQRLHMPYISYRALPEKTFSSWWLAELGVGNQIRLRALLQYWLRQAYSAAYLLISMCTTKLYFWWQ